MNVGEQRGERGGGGTGRENDEQRGHFRLIAYLILFLPKYHPFLSNSTDEKMDSNRNISLNLLHGRKRVVDL